jgi:hypothetical protein
VNLDINSDSSYNHKLLIFRLAKNVRFSIIVTVAPERFRNKGSSVFRAFELRGRYIGVAEPLLDLLGRRFAYVQVFHDSTTALMKPSQLAHGQHSAAESRVRGYCLFAHRNLLRSACSIQFIAATKVSP